MGSHIVQTRNCKNCSKDFNINESDIAFYRRVKVTLPTWCPPCRHLRRHGSINDYIYYSRNCDKCQKTFISIFPPKSEYIVYCPGCWYAEGRDHFAEGREYDFSRGFFEQFNELMHAAPQLGMVGINNDNCDFCESVGNCKNCYLISESSHCEDCYYGYWLQKSKDCIDCMYIHECERSYQLLHCFNCYKLSYSKNCVNCNESYFLDNCSGCKNCFLSTNLRHKQFYIFNKAYAEKEYFEAIKKFNLKSPQVIAFLKDKFEDFLKTQPRKNLQIENTEGCSGDYIRNAKNCRKVFHCYDAEDCAYGEHVFRGAKNCFDSNTAGRNAELLYETTNSGINSYNIKFSRYCWGCRDTEYSSQCKSGESLFGCVSLKPGAQYCIFNKKYSPQEYEDLANRIRKKMVEDKEYGEFFPLSMALFGYNNSVSFDEFPYTKEETQLKGWKWEEQQSGTRGKGTVKMAELPKEIDEVSDSILKEILTCDGQLGNGETCEKNYRIIPQELAFYRSEGIPLPRRCPDCRNRERLGLRNKKIPQIIECAQCKKPTQTTLNPKKYVTILCNGCYKNEVY